jgi:hypothetical protein
VDGDDDLDFIALFVTGINAAGFESRVAIRLNDGTGRPM